MTWQEWKKNDMDANFKRDVEQVLNKHGVDSILGTPDYVLSDYIYHCLRAYEDARIATERQKK